jgi:hypothetical protein
MPYERDRITQDDVQSACESVRDNGNVHHLHRDHGQTRFTVAIRYGDFGQGPDVWWIDDNQADDRDKAFHSDDIFVVIEHVLAFLNQEPVRYGAVVVFPPNYTRQEAEDAISSISKHIDRNYYVAGRSIPRTLVTAFDGRDGGPVWYIP